MGLFSRIFGSKKSDKVRIIELTDPIYFRVNTDSTITGEEVGKLDNLIFIDRLDGFERCQLGFQGGTLLRNDLRFLDSNCNYYADNELSNNKSDLVANNDDNFRYKFLYNGKDAIYYLDGSRYVNTVDLTRDVFINIYRNRDGFSNSFSICPINGITNNQLFTSEEEAKSLLEEMKMNILNEKLSKI